MDAKQSVGRLSGSGKLCQAWHWFQSLRLVIGRALIIQIATVARAFAWKTATEVLK